MTKLIHFKGAAPMVPFITSIKQSIFRDTGRFGLFQFADYEFGAQNSIGRDFDGVYQMRHCHEGYIPVKMRFQISRENTPTVKRLAAWNKFRAAISAWKSLTSEQKQVYYNRENKKHRRGNNIFITEYMLSH